MKIIVSLHLRVKVTVDWLQILFLILEVIDLILSPEASYLDGGSIWFSSFSSGKFWNDSLKHVLPHCSHFIIHIILIKHLKWLRKRL